MGALIDCCRKKSKTIRMKPEEISAKKNIFGFSMLGKKKEIDQVGQDVLDEIFPDLGKNSRFIAVYDGHGSRGKEAAMLAKDEVRKALIDDRENLVNKLKDKKESERYFVKLFRSIQNKYKKKPQDYDLSGTCAVCVLQMDQKCYFINLGDSRAVMGVKAVTSTAGVFQIYAYQMTIDHKANREDEKKRVDANQGIVLNERNGITGPPRVYPKNEDGPGLCVSRSFGDVLLHSFGVSEEPEISFKDIESEDKFIIIGSDGLWDVMNSAEAVGFVFQKLEQFTKDKLAEELVKESRSRWEAINNYKFKLQMERNKDNNLLQGNFKSNNMMSIDDITAVIMFLNDV
jgi:integrin-linked kinase-associated serine/threonine phosphatase 2C